MTSPETLKPSPAAVWEAAKEQLAAHLPGYESRVAQETAAIAIIKAMQEGKHLIVNAGCGCGKSMAELIPSIFPQVTEGERVIIATASKALQDQLSQKDVPFVSEVFGNFDWTVLKGRSNYLCLNRARDNVDEDPICQEVISRARSIEGFNGQIDSLGMDLSPAQRRLVASDADECDEDCAGSPECFADLARRKAKDAQLVIVNHAVLFTDLMLKSRSDGAASMLGDYGIVVIDELHEAESFCQNALGREFSEFSVTALVADIRAFVARVYSSAGGVNTILDAGKAVEGARAILWNSIGDLMADQSSTLLFDDAVLTQIGAELGGMTNSLIALAESMGSLKSRSVPTGQRKDIKRLRSLTRRARRFADDFISICTSDWAEMARWLQKVEHKSGPRFVIKAVPLKVNDFLASTLFEDATVIGTSATAKINGSFDFIASRLGFAEVGYNGVDAGSPFDFPTQGRLYVPVDFPSPKDTRNWQPRVVEEIKDLVSASNGRALVLFTSRSEMNRVYEQLAPGLPYTCYVQGDAPNDVLAHRFKEDVHSVLFATRSFFTGIDIPGDSLSLVIINKLPFMSPGDPLVMAMTNALKREGRNDFVEFAIPQMVLPLEQASGRLIRHRNDRGVLAILDSRLTQSGWGRKVMKTLPPMTRITSLKDVESFLVPVS